MEDELKNTSDLKVTDKRETWTGKFDFFFSALGYAGNIFSLYLFFFI